MLDLILIVLLILVLAFVGRIVNASSQTEERPRHTDDDFARVFFSGREVGKTAARLRGLLARSLRTDLAALTPDDRLDEDLDSDIASNLDLFRAIETEFEIDLELENAARFQAETARIKTFRDLVKYVHKRKYKTMWNWRELADPSSDYWPSIVGWSWCSGLGICLIGGLAKSQTFLYAGFVVCFLPITLFAGAWVSRIVSDTAEYVRKNGILSLLLRPDVLLLTLAALVPYFAIQHIGLKTLYAVFFGPD